MKFSNNSFVHEQNQQKTIFSQDIGEVYFQGQ